MAAPDSSRWLHTCTISMLELVARVGWVLSVRADTHIFSSTAQDYLDQVQNRTKEKRYTFDIAFETMVREPCHAGAKEIAGGPAGGVGMGMGVGMGRASMREACAG